MTALRLVLVVSGAAGITNEERRRRKLPAIFGSDTGWKFCAIHAKGAALVIDQAPRPELSNRKKPCALEKCGSPARSATDRRHIGVERQSRKVVAGQEAFGRETTVRVKIRAAARCAPLEQCKLLIGLDLLLLCCPAFPGAQPVHL